VFLSLAPLMIIVGRLYKYSMDSSMRDSFDIRNNKRINNTIFSPLEKKVLRFLAMRTPEWVTPNVLTLVGFLGAVLVFLGYWLSSINENFLWLASFGWICNWYGDSLDGTIARYRKIEKPRYGFYIDHNIDVFGETLIGIGFGLSPYIRFDIALLLLISYLLLNIQVYTFAYATKIFRISYGKIGATEFRAFAIFMNIFLYFCDFPRTGMLHQKWSLFDFMALIFISIMIIMFGITVLLNSIRLYKSDS
jgi:archaetidylinositol phosphate synthase